jgi:pSer/pThr/pTyr-binding forkhead associated (FHA) protein
MEGGDFAPRRAGKAVAQLVLIDSAGADGGSLMLKEGDTPVGRACGAHIFEADPHLSPRHATLRLSGGHAQVRDEASLNGVFVRLRGEASLEEGDQLRIGQELLRFERLDPGPPPAAPDGTRPFGSPAPEDAWGRLVQVAGPQQAGDAYFLRDREVVLGRAYGDVLFPDDQFVSGTHCRLSRRGGKVLLTDLGSSNGTYLRVQGEAPVEFGDLLLMGQ